MDNLSELNDNDWTELSHAIGSVVVFWNMVEHPLDYLVAIFYHIFDARSLMKKFNNEVPKAFNNKTELLKKCFNQINQLLPFKNEGLFLLDHAIQLADKRNDMIHMILMGKAPDNSYMFNKIDYKEKHHSRQLSYSIPQILDFGKEILNLGVKLTNFVHLVQKHYEHLLLRQQ